MAISKKEFTQYIREFKFKELFNDMGWEKDKTSQSVTVDNVAYSMQGLAEKRGFKILLCQAPNGLVPEYSIRKKIETKVTKLFQEHLIIYVDAKNQDQVWQIVVRQIGKPTKVSETTYRVTQDPELLYQRAAGIIFELDEEEKVTIVDVTQRITENFQQNNERVTKQFYDKFSKEHTSFIKFIKGIEENVDKEWYASLMLNRLMFCYFIQKKGFLDNNKDYLLDKLKASQQKKGKNKFYSFYRSFLLTLFHQGLGAPDHSKDLKEEIGKVPYLNGGLFEEHVLEATNPKIDIDDKAFERIFEFFDQYEWHLDTRHTASGKDINPDVIGYIFEKYINDRADMGAYYTKEDITDYISKNCVLPYLFDETKRNYAKAFIPEGEIWQMVKTSGDEYIYGAVKHGANTALPKEISKGIKDVAQRTEWNKPALAEFALPTEIWREVVERRNRYEEVKAKIVKGEVQAINDFITYNLNISQFVQDVVESTTDTEFLKTFYKALNSVTIIDPTCGSGAFLFAAMNILEPLYEACIMRMRAFVEDEDRINKEEKTTFSHKYKFFREVLEEIQSPQHPNLQYFIYKSIILRNLYGVDIMKEAVEIAKLRLFLKLVATVEADFRKPNLGLEPLPDIDFNIRAGNTLIGFATEAELNKGLTYTLDGVQAKPVVEEKCDVVAKTFKRYKEIQLTYGDDYKQFKKAKEELNKRLKELNHELNQLLYKQTPAIKYDKWLASHQPFHWFAEFYEIIHDKGGFDVIIGNPPYVEYSKVKKSYTVSNLTVQVSGNLFAFVIERGNQIISKEGYFSFIVPISIVCTQRMEALQKHAFNSNTVWLSNFGERPSKLFTGAEVLLTIFISSPERKMPNTYTTTFIKWKSEERSILFNKLFYNKISSKPKNYVIPKIGFGLENHILSKTKRNNKSLGLDLLNESKHRIYYRIGGGRYWKIFTDFSPKFILNGKTSTSSRENYLFTKSEDEKKAMISILSSSLFYWYFVLTTNCRDLNPSDLREFPLCISDMKPKSVKALSKLCDVLMDDYRKNSQMKEKVSVKTGNIVYQEFYPRLSKEIIDQIDLVLGDEYGFTQEETEFIINYDIKYRMGKELEEED
jgi:hypothetical protein